MDRGGKSAGKPERVRVALFSVLGHADAQDERDILVHSGAPDRNRRRFLVADATQERRDGGRDERPLTGDAL